jgi:hypothetical protein
MTHPALISEIQLLQRQAASLLLYQSVLASPGGQAFLVLLDALRHHAADSIPILQAYGKWFETLAIAGLSWPEYLLAQVLSADNAFTQQIQRLERSALPTALVAAAQQDLRTLQVLSQSGSSTLSQWVQSATGLSSPVIPWEIAAPQQVSPKVWQQFETEADWGAALETLIAYYQQQGVGLFGTYQALRWQSGQLVGIRHPDPIQLQELVGYEWQKTALIQNTEALLAGLPALHVLLYGSRGSGKSSLVKSLLHPYREQGLRLVEVAKADLRDLPIVVDRLRLVPQKFIIFVDDLSFEEDDDTYKALKVVLEGNLVARPANVVVYATSNRRHLVREFFDDRPRPRDADEIHQWDTVQEKLSFSDRFGLTLTFEPANQDIYLTIVRHLAENAGIAIAPATLEQRALQWATRHNGRSGRTARQFVDFLRAEQRGGRGVGSRE